ncbi:hypothetical protein VTK56DRAFT_3311 [Thermocarpiscus australiensis]
MSPSWDNQRRTFDGSRRSKPRLALGDAFPRLDPSHIEMERERALLSPVFEDQPGPPSTPALVVHVEIRFTDPVIRSRYYRSYGSSPRFEPTNRLCRGLLRHIERCSEELLTRKDSSALETFNDGAYEPKPQRFDMTFRITRRGMGEWAERTYRSYQKQPLTVAFTKEVILATHRMIGLFLRRHDQNFQWLDCPVSEADSEGDETAMPSRNVPPSLLSVPRSRFIEATQTFEFVPGYSIKLMFRSTNSQRKVRVFERKLEVNSAQTGPLTQFMSEDLLWKILRAVNQGLDSKEPEMDDRFQHNHALHSLPLDDDALEIDLRISNNIGPMYHHVHRNVKSRLALFRDSESRDCDGFLSSIETYLVRARDETDAKINAMNDLEFRIVELKGEGWALQEPAKFTLGPSASYDRGTIQAALDRIQTGIRDVIRGHSVALRINAHKRGHLVLDKAIVAHEKRGKLKETFASAEEAKITLVSRLESRIQGDIDKVFDDTCSIDDIPEDEQEHSVRPSTPAQPEPTSSEGETSPGYGLSPQYSPGSKSKTVSRGMLRSLRPRAQRVFSLSRRSAESIGSIDYLGASGSSFAHGHSRPSTAASEQNSEPCFGENSLDEARAPVNSVAERRPAPRSFSLVPRRLSSAIHVENASALIEELAPYVNPSGHSYNDAGADTALGSAGVKKSPEACCNHEAMTSREVDASPASFLPGRLPAQVPPLGFDAVFTSNTTEDAEISLQNDDNKAASSIFHQTTKKMMETPDTFLDAREFPISPAVEGANSESSSALTAGASPNDDEFSTPPSTPELSTGGSSPRHSILTTPTFPRTNSGPKDPHLYPESEPEDPGLDPVGEVAEVPASKEYRDRSTADESFCGQSGVGRPLQASAAPRVAVERFDSCIAADGRHVAGRPSSASGQETSDIELTSTPISSGASKDFDQTAGEKTASESQIHPERFGAEFDAHFRDPDFPTAEVRRSEPNTAHDCGSVAHCPSPGAVLEPDSICVPQTPPKSHIGQEAGKEFGTGAGTEAKLAEDNICGDVCSDTSEVPLRVHPDQDHDAELEAVPSDNESTGEIALQGAEDLLRDVGGAGTDRGEVPRSDAGAEVTRDTQCSVGSEGVDGPGLVADGQEKEPTATENVTPVDVGPGVEANACSNEAIGGPVLEGNSEKNIGPCSGTEDVTLKPGDETGVKVADVGDEHRTVPEADTTANVDSADSGAVPGDTAAESEPKVESQVTTPTGFGPEKDVDLRVDLDVVVSGPEIRPRQPVSGDGSEAEGQGIVPEAQASVREFGDEKLPTGEELREESMTVPTAGDATETENPEHGASEEPVESADDSAIVSPKTKLTGTDTGARTGVSSETLERDLANELEARVNGDIGNVSVSKDETSKYEPGEEKCVAPDDPSQGLFEAVTQSGTKFSEADVVDENLAQELEVQPDDTVDDESHLSGRKLELQLEVEQGADRDTRDKQSEPEAGSDETGNPPGDEGGKPDVEEDVGTGPEIPGLQSDDEQHVAAPAIRIEGLTAPVYDVSIATVEKPDIAASDVITAEPTELPPPEIPEPASDIERPHLAPVPELTKLFPTSPRSSLSTLRPDDASFISSTTRGSVDTFRPSTDEQQHPAIPESPHASRPQTAGYFGLRESRFVEVGLRGALGDPRRLGLPLQHMLDQQDLDGGLSAAGRQSAPASEAGGGGSRLRKRKGEDRSRPGLGVEQECDGEGDLGDRAALPKMMMFLAGALAIGKMMRGSLS